MTRALLLGVGAVGLAWLAARQAAQATAPVEVEQDADPWNLENLIEEATDTMNTINPPAPSEADTAARNVAAFLMSIRHAEGTAGPDGYRTLFGGRLFEGWSDHPRQAKQFTDREGRTLWTSAAGAYQFMAISPLPTGGATRVDTWDRIARKVGLTDFTPDSQDRAAVELIDEAGALRDVEAGRFAEAVHKVRRIWASMPGAGYSQGERSIDWLASKYSSAGGVFA